MPFCDADIGRSIISITMVVLKTKRLALVGTRAVLLLLFAWVIAYGASVEEDSFRYPDAAASILLRGDDKHPVVLLKGGKNALMAEYRAQMGGSPSYPFQNFSKAFVDEALSQGIDWREHNAVTPAKDQGRHGYCGTFGRVAAAGTLLFFSFSFPSSHAQFQKDSLLCERNSSATFLKRNSWTASAGIGINFHTLA